MSLDTILQAIETDCAKEIQRLEARAGQEIQALREQACQEAERVRCQAIEETIRPAYREGARLRHQASLDALRIVDEARKQLLDAALRETRDRLSCARTAPDYPDLLGFLALQAISALRSSLQPGETPRLLADRRDRDVIEGLLQSWADPPQVEYSLSCWGGVVAESQDGCVTVDNPLDARLERAMPLIHNRLGEMLETL
jgi:vacuolar-type H+-ATPase subunit E/Vma4